MRKENGGEEEKGEEEEEEERVGEIYDMSDITVDRGGRSSTERMHSTRGFLILNYKWHFSGL